MGPLFLLLIIYSTAAGPVYDRIDPHNHLPQCLCRMNFLSAIPEDSVPEMINTILGQRKNQLSLAYRLNCSFTGSDGNDIGSDINQTTGAYSGLIGRAQRNDTEVAAFLYRMDYFHAEYPLPGIPVSLGWSADVVIFMQKNGSHTGSLSLIELCIGNFDAITVQFILISFFIFSVTLAFTGNPSFSVKSLVNNIIDNMYRSVFAIIDQENFDADDDHARIAVLFFNLFLLFGIHGIMFGLIGSDLVTDIDPPIIQSLDEFSNDSFVQPKILKTWWLLPVLEKTRNGSELWPLKQAVEAHAEDNILAVPLDMVGMQALIGRLNGYDKALILPHIFTLHTRGLACQFAPEMMKGFATSDHSFAQGVFATLLNFNIDPVLREMIEFLLMTQAEVGMELAMTRYAVSHRLIPDVVHDEDRFNKTNKCLEGFKHENRHPEPFYLHTYRPLFELAGYLIAFAFIILMTELVAASIVRCKRGKSVTNIRTTDRRFKSCVIRLMKERRYQSERPRRAANVSNQDVMEQESIERSSKRISTIEEKTDSCDLPSIEC